MRVQPAFSFGVEYDVSSSKIVKRDESELAGCALWDSNPLLRSLRRCAVFNMCVLVESKKEERKRFGGWFLRFLSLDSTSKFSRSCSSNSVPPQSSARSTWLMFGEFGGQGGWSDGRLFVRMPESYTCRNIVCGFRHRSLVVARLLGWFVCRRSGMTLAGCTARQPTGS